MGFHRGNFVYEIRPYRKRGPTKIPLSQVQKGGARPRADFSLSAIELYNTPPPQKIRKIRNAGTNSSAIGLHYTALRSKWTEGARKAAL